MEHKKPVIPIIIIKDLFNAEKTDSVPHLDVIAFEAYGSPIALGRGRLGGRYSTEKVCIRMNDQGKIRYYHLDWIWAGGIYGSRFTGPSDAWEGENFTKDNAGIRLLPSPEASGSTEIRDLFNAERSRRHCCVLNVQRRDPDLILNFTYAEQQNPAAGPALQTTIQYRPDSPTMIKVGDTRLNQSSSSSPR